MPIPPLTPIRLPPPALAAGRFLLRRIGPGDESLERALSDCDDVVAWTFYPPALSGEQARERIVRSQSQSTDGHAARYVVELDGAALGTAGIKNTDDAPEIFYALLPAGRGRGAATAAAAALSGWALESGAPYAALWTLPGNTASERVAARAGFFCADFADGDGSHGIGPGDVLAPAGPRLWTRFPD